MFELHLATASSGMLEGLMQSPVKTFTGLLSLFLRDLMMTLIRPRPVGIASASGSEHAPRGMPALHSPAGETATERD
jgi:hypothetical protein